MSTDAQFKSKLVVTVVILIGDCRVGKTSYLNYIIKKGSINKGQSQPPTIGVEYAPAKVRVRGQQVKINLWDTSGAEKYKAITSSYYRKCQGAVIMFDLTDAQSFKNLEIWFREIEKMTTKKFAKIVVGNKLDLVQSGQKQRMVSQTKIIDFCQKHEVTYKYTSAVSGLNINQSFIELIEKILDEGDQGAQTQMHSLSLDINNPDLSLLPHDGPQNKNIKIGDSESGCPRCC